MGVKWSEIQVFQMEGDGSINARAFKDRKNYVDIMYINTCSQINPKFYRGTIIVNLIPSLGKLFFD